MGADFFLDTNIVVYAFDADAASHKVQTARKWIRDGLVDGKGAVSTQVLQEFYVTVTRKIKTPLDLDDAEAAVEGLCRLKIMDVDVPLIQTAIRISRNDRISFWDALICAAPVGPVAIPSSRKTWITAKSTPGS